MQSVFRELEWRSNRHFLNPSKWKEYELHVSGLGFLNKFNFFRDYFEKFAHIDPLTEKELDGLHQRTTIHLIRKELSSSERELLEKHGFHLIKTWATLVINTSKGPVLDRKNMSIVRKGEKFLKFSEVKDLEELREYHLVYKKVRAEEGLKTASFKEYEKIFGNKFYRVFVAKYEGKIVAGIGAIFNKNYMLQLNIARDKDFSYAADYLTYMIIEYCKKHGIRWFDLAGIDPSPEAGTKDYFIRKYKEKWGGEFFNEYMFKR